jgi:hypothetical protein
LMVSPCVSAFPLVFHCLFFLKPPTVWGREAVCRRDLGEGRCFVAPAGITAGVDGRLREVWEAGERPRVWDECWAGTNFGGEYPLILWNMMENEGKSR